MEQAGQTGQRPYRGRVRVCPSGRASVCLLPARLAPHTPMATPISTQNLTPIAAYYQRKPPAKGIQQWPL